MQIFCISIVYRKNAKVNKGKESGESRAFLLFRKSREENRIGIPEAIEEKGETFSSVFRIYVEE